MDLNTVTSVVRPRSRAELTPHRSGDAWLGGGTWLFSEPQPAVRRLVDLQSMRWPPLARENGGLLIAATCPVAVLEALEPPMEWSAGFLIGECCRAFWASHKIRNVATVGGNLCLALPAGPMIPLAAALDGSCTIWTPDGGARRVPAADFVVGPGLTVLEPGELLRSVELPDAALRRRAAFRKASLTPLGRSAALLIGTLGADGAFALTIAASTPRPVRLSFAALPNADVLQQRLAEVLPADAYFDDVHGRPEWRRHLTATFAAEIAAELGATAP